MCNVFVGICLLHFLDIITYMGRVDTSFDARMWYLRPSVSSCTLFNCVTINMIYRPTLLQDIYILSQICLVSKLYCCPAYIYRFRLYSYIVIHYRPLLFHPLTLSYCLPPYYVNVVVQCLLYYIHVCMCNFIGYMLAYCSFNTFIP